MRNNKEVPLLNVTSSKDIKDIAVTVSMKKIGKNHTIL